MAVKISPSVLTADFLELKENLKKLADAALQQIDEKKYDTQLKSTGVTKIVKYGIAFCAKDVEISSVMNWF